MTTDIAHKQPKSLRYLFLTELWERFSYWSTQSLLVLYMIKHLMFHDTQAYLLFSAFGALMMAMPVIGGMIADRVIGFQRTILLGAVCLSIGYYLFCFNHMYAVYIGMALLICGNGLLKPNISALLGTCYKTNDRRRQNGYTIFYFGINCGSLLGIILCGFIAAHFGYKAAFAVSGTALIIGLIIFSIGQGQIHRDQVNVNYKAFDLSTVNANLRLIAIIAAILVLVAPLYLCLHHPEATNTIMVIVAVILLSYLALEVIRSKSKERPAFIIAILLTLFSVVFWGLYMQMPMSLTLFCARAVDLHLFGISIPASTVLSMNGGLILICTPLVIRLWNYLRFRNIEPSISAKFAIGTLLIGVGFIALAYGASTVNDHHKAALFTVFLGYLGLTLGELSLSPIGLAMISQYTPKRVNGLMMGSWFFALAASYSIAGQLAKLASITKADAHNPVLIGHTYYHAFIEYALIGIGIGMIMLLVAPIFNRIAEKSH